MIHRFHVHVYPLAIPSRILRAFELPNIVSFMRQYMTTIVQILHTELLRRVCAPT